MKTLNLENKIPQRIQEILETFSGPFGEILKSRIPVSTIVIRLCNNRAFCETAGLEYSNNNATIIETAVRYFYLK